MRKAISCTDSDIYNEPAKCTGSCVRRPGKSLFYEAIFLMMRAHKEQYVVELPSGDGVFRIVWLPKVDGNKL